MGLRAMKNYYFILLFSYDVIILLYICIYAFNDHHDIVRAVYFKAILSYHALLFKIVDEVSGLMVKRRSKKNVLNREASVREMENDDENGSSCKFITVRNINNM